MTVTWTSTRATNGDVELYVEQAGPDEGEVVLLVGGADATAARWPDSLVAPLVEAGLRVVRFDHRDTGRSTLTDPDRPYRLEAMAADVVAVLDAVGAQRAHLVGYSLGGAIAQLLALGDDAGRVASLVLVATTPGLGDDRLPGPDDDFAQAVAQRWFDGPPRRADRDACVAWTVELYRLLAGTRFAFDDEAQRALAEAEHDWRWQPETGHGLAHTATPSRLDRLGEIRVPVTVVHGTADPVFGVEHAQALARGLADARLELVEALGHEIPAAFGPALAERVLATVARAR